MFFFFLQKANMLFDLKNKFQIIYLERFFVFLFYIHFCITSYYYVRSQILP